MQKTIRIIVTETKHYRALMDKPSLIKQYAKIPPVTLVKLRYDDGTKRVTSHDLINSL